jgi:4-amino-4-deoxy-L-arabinose transferase-like glycosyltransferase
MRIKSVIITFVLLFASFSVLLYVSPALLKITDLDYAIFQYSGKAILQGKLPYVDFFDHKPPAMFYLNALALFLFKGSRWGIWVFEIIALSSSSLLCFSFLKKYFGTMGAFLATIAFVFNLTYVHNGGNLTEEFALPLHFAILFMLSKWAEGNKPGLNAYLIGVFAGIASCLKQTLGGILLGVIAFMVVQLLSDKNIKRFLRSTVVILAGLTTVWGAWVIYFSSKGILAPFWETAFAFNFAYVSLSTTERISALGMNISDLFGKSPYFMISLLSYIVCIPVAILSSRAVFKQLTNKWISALFFLFAGLGIYNGLFRHGLTLYSLDQIGTRQIAEIILGIGFGVTGWLWTRTKFTTILRNLLDKRYTISYEQISVPVIVCLVDLPVQLVMISLSGRGYDHYFMSALPALSILCAMFLWFLGTRMKDQMRTVWVWVFFIPLLLPALMNGIEKTKSSEDATVKELTQYIVEHTSSDEEIFIWSNRVPIYIESDRMSSSTYFFLSPLFLDSYQNSDLTARLLKDFEENPAALIIASTNFKRPFFYSEDPAYCMALSDTEELKELSETNYGTQVFVPEGMPEVYEYICKNYTSVDPQSDKLRSYGMYFLEYTPDRK